MEPCAAEGNTGNLTEISEFSTLQLFRLQHLLLAEHQTQPPKSHLLAEIEAVKDYLRSVGLNKELHTIEGNEHRRVWGGIVNSPIQEPGTCKENQKPHLKQGFCIDWKPVG